MYAAQVNSIQQTGEFFNADNACCRCSFRLQVAGELETAAFQTLVPDRQSIAIPVKNLQSVTGAITEQEQSSAERILLQQFTHHSAQSIKAAPHVGWLQTGIHSNLMQRTNHW